MSPLLAGYILELRTGAVGYKEVPCGDGAAGQGSGGFQKLLFIRGNAKTGMQFTGCPGRA